MAFIRQTQGYSCRSMQNDRGIWSVGFTVVYQERAGSKLRRITLSGCRLRQFDQHDGRHTLPVLSEQVYRGVKRQNIEVAGKSAIGSK